MSDLTLTLYAMAAFTFAFLATALVEEWRMTRRNLVPRPVRVTRNSRERVTR